VAITRPRGSFIANLQRARLDDHTRPFKGTRESLSAYHVPDWFADAKFGIWNHWGPQSAAEYGDWYARRMYVEGEPQYRHHLEKYGHPSKTGLRTSSSLGKPTNSTRITSWVSI